MTSAKMNTVSVTPGMVYNIGVKVLHVIICNMGRRDLPDMYV